ncbi:MAG: type IV secretory system conjugative DNA transfer family protein, partial [Ureaplasma sp.]|nr:type IV secretory system conjugative DNA transfer family protein [Ureaplasma sp.]
QLKVLLDFYSKEKINNIFTANTWYVIVYGSNEQELNENFNTSWNNWNRLFLCQELNLDENIKLLKNLWEPLEQYNEENVNQFNQLPDGEMNIYTDNFKIGKNYYSLGTLNSEKFPLEIDLFWLNRISRVEDTSFVINLHPISTEQSKKIIQKSINNSAYMEHQVNRYKQAVLKTEFQNQMRVIELIKDSIATGREILINTNILFLTYGNSSSNCKSNVSKLKQALKNENMYYNSLIYRQKDFLANIIPNGFDDKIATDSIVFPAGPLAGSFPIMESYQIDVSGCYLGTSSHNKSPVVVDVNLRDEKKRINSNGLVLGNTGSGKTTTVKKILNNHLANNGIAFVLDPEEDYVALTKYYDGQVIDAANGNIS